MASNEQLKAGDDVEYIWQLSKYNKILYTTAKVF